MSGTAIFVNGHKVGTAVWHGIGELTLSTVGSIATSETFIYQVGEIHYDFGECILLWETETVAYFLDLSEAFNDSTTSPEDPYRYIPSTEIHAKPYHGNIQDFLKLGIQLAE